MAPAGAAKLPLTVTEVAYAGAQLWAVKVAFADGTVQSFLVPQTMATVEAVTISALAMGVLLSLPANQATAPHRKHPRYTPRTPT